MKHLKEVMLWKEKDLLADLKDFQLPPENLYGVMHLEQ
jgi:hypothetical protein